MSKHGFPETSNNLQLPAFPRTKQHIPDFPIENVLMSDFHFLPGKGSVLEILEVFPGKCSLRKSMIVFMNSFWKLLYFLSFLVSFFFPLAVADDCYESRPEYCAKNTHLCKAPGFEDLMKKMCPRHCGYCDLEGKGSVKIYLVPGPGPSSRLKNLHFLQPQEKPK